MRFAFRAIAWTEATELGYLPSLQRDKGYQFIPVYQRHVFESIMCDPRAGIHSEEITAEVSGRDFVCTTPCPVHLL